MSLKLYVTTLILSLALTGSVSAADSTKLREIRGNSEEYEEAFKELLAKTQLKATWERGKGPSSSEKKVWKQDSCDRSDDPHNLRSEVLFFPSIEPQEGCWAKLIENQSLLPKELSDRPPKVEFEIIKTEQPDTRISNGGIVSVRDSTVIFEKVTKGWNAGISLVFSSFIPLATLDILHAGYSETWESGQSVIRAVDHKNTCPQGFYCYWETWTLMATYTGKCAPHVLFQPRCDPPEAFEPCPAFRDYASSNGSISWPEAPTPWDEKLDGGDYKCIDWYNTSYEHCKTVEDLHTDCQLRLPTLDSSRTRLWSTYHWVMIDVFQAVKKLRDDEPITVPSPTGADLKETKDAPEAVEAHSQHQCVWRLANGHYYYEVTDGYVFKQEDGEWISEIQSLPQFNPPKVSDQLRSSANCSCNTLMDIRRGAGVDQDTPTKCHGAAITSLNGVVCGLFKNSLDGGASRVLIRLDYAHGNCSVEDDGLGIEPGEFREDGGLGKLHHTSKTSPSSRIHGSRGDFLASLAGLSLLSITSRHRGHLSHSSVAIHNSKVLKRQTPASAEQRLATFDHGTRVTVHALFGSMPVRVKHQASVFSARSAVDKEWARLVHEIVALLVSWPSEVSVLLTETAVRRELRLKSSAGVDLAVRSSRLFSQASLADADDADSWVPISASSRYVRVKGCISTNPVVSRRAQMMSLGVQPILNTHECNFLYEAVNQVFDESSFGVVENATGKPRKGLERWPMFYLQMTLPNSEMSAFDMSNESHRVVGDIVRLLKVLSFEFLKKQCLRPRAIDCQRRSTPRVAKESKQPVSQMPSRKLQLDDWPHVKVGHVSRRPSNGPVTPRLVGEGGKLLGMPFEDGSRQTDAETRVVHRSPAGGRRRLRVLESTTAAKRQPSGWLRAVLDSWQNPVFETAEAAIPSVHACGDVVRFDSKSVPLEGRLSRSALGSAEVIGQVDRKFVLVRLRLRDGGEGEEGEEATGLVAIDQHAADERCRLEELCRGYFDGDGYDAVSEPLERPVLFEASGREGELLRQYREHFASWGVVYVLDGHERVRVTRLPPSIAERCSGEPRLLIDLVRREAWALADGLVAARKKGKKGKKVDGLSWPSRLRGCPSGILELLYSRSCRSAIMFNDELSDEECASLVRRLAQCAFPFQCAHGRPSMVPLADLGMGGGRDSREGRAVGVEGWKRFADGGADSLPLA
ncbi:hypothetical protein CP532_2168 [Ophiocordyceps camponoti-leonardi (nom. inval.)]|nr:hypothetical protein CP532_2168 [Ophiocordyceps camponoti-leonardi (nom. inval.)]